MNKMNKTLIIVLAVCLVSAHAFVKRDAPAADKGITLEDITKQLETISKDAKAKLDETFSPENLKKSISDIQTNVNKVIEDLKKRTDELNKQ